MSIVCVLGTIGNAGMSFTENINNNLIKMYNYTRNCDDLVGYKEFQKRIFNSCSISESNVRMYSPFLFFHGFINDYKTGAEFKVSEYFTSLGKAYIKALLISKQLEVEEQKQLAQSIVKDILALSMFSRKEKNQKDYYFDFLSFCVEYEYISAKEFNYMLYEKEALNNENYIKSIAEKISEFRQGNIDFEFLQDRTNKKGEKVRDEFPDNTFNYTRTLLVEAGLIVETENKKYKINPAKEKIIYKLVMEEA